MSLAQKLQAKYSQASGSSGQDAAEPKKALKDFIAKAPHSRYAFDSERDAPESELCREGDGKGRECITLHMQSRQLFQAMQDQGFFCALPMDPTRTHIECTRIADTPVDQL